MDKIALDSDVGETWMMRRARHKDGNDCDIPPCFYGPVFARLADGVGILHLGYVVDCQLSSLTIDTASPGQCATRDA